MDGTIVQDFTFNNLLIYPNPAKTFAEIKFENPKNKNFEIRIFDKTGKLIFSDKTNRNTYKLNTKNYSAGVYNVLIYNSEISFSGKLVIQ